MAIIFLIGCKQPGSETTNQSNIDTDAEIVTIRNCEYIKSHVYGGDVYIHAADCKNLIH